MLEALLEETATQVKASRARKRQRRQTWASVAGVAVPGPYRDQKVPKWKGAQKPTFLVGWLLMWALGLETEEADRG